MALRSELSKLVLVQEDEFDTLTDEELVARVTAYHSKGESHPDEARRDAVEPPPPTPASEAVANDLSFWVVVRDVEDSLTVDEAVELIAAEITQHLDPFAGMDADHPFFAELPLHVRAVLVKLAVAGQQTLHGDDIPVIARDAVRRLKYRATRSTLPREVLEFAAIDSAPAEPAIQPPGNGVQGEVGG